MDQESEVLEAIAEPVEDAAQAAADPAQADAEPAPPIESRFLYVDVAAQRAKQLRRGALPRLEELAGESAAATPATLRHKLERIAMREVDRGKIRYDVPGSAREE
jgi:DNA-directed RNA polymerase omega subunit